MKVVVTAESTDGKSVVVSESDATPLVASAFPMFANTPIAAADRIPRLPEAGRPEPHQMFFPPPGGYRFFLLTIAGTDPDVAAHVPSAEELVDAEALFPGLSSVYDESGMERTDSIDFGFVVHGSVVLVLDDGVETVLRAGDAWVQNGARHRWRNPGAEPVSMVVVIVGAERTTS